MQKPDITIYDVSTEVRERLQSATTTIITTLTFSFRMGEETYDTLTVSGEGSRYEDSLRDAADNIDWTIYLDATFDDEEIAILRAANLAYEADLQGAWLSESQLAMQAQVKVALSVESSPINLLASNRLLERVHMPYGSWHYRITDLGREMVSSHRQFKRILVLSQDGTYPGRILSEDSTTMTVLWFKWGFDGETFTSVEERDALTPLSHRDCIIRFGSLPPTDDEGL